MKFKNCSAIIHHMDSKRLGLKLLVTLETLLVEQNVTKAAPSYLQRTSRPKVPEDIAKYRATRMTNVAGSEALELGRPNEDRCVVELAVMFRINHGLAARQALVAGRGIAPAHRWLVDDLLKASDLEVLRRTTHCRWFRSV
ncbi:MAG: hypothetical protein K8H87_00425 [Pseudorhodoplanes sp.]|nr:hypothetical protein [Pseudorhodoplanes sp.]